MSITVKLECKKHPRYKAKREPKDGKCGCLFIWETLNPNPWSFADENPSILDTQRVDE